MRKLDIIIFAGQSNMQGQSDSLSNADVVEHAYEYKYIQNQMVPLKNPVGENIKYDMSEGYFFDEHTDLDTWLQDHALGAACYGYTNLVPEFCREYLNIIQEPTDILAVHVAKGSTRIAKWLPDTPGHEVLIQKCRAAIEFAKHIGEISHIFVVWLQGESDAVSRISKEEYKEKICILNDALKKQLGIECFGIIRVGRFTNDERDDEIIFAQKEVCEENPDFFMLTEMATELNKQAEYMNPYVEGHYSARGLEVLGSLAGRTFAEYRNKTSKC